MSDKPEKTTTSDKASKGLIMALIAAFAVIILLVTAIIYLYMHRYTGEPQNAQGGNEAANEEVNEEVLNALDMAEAAASETEEGSRPDGWYGTFESSGSITGDADLGSYIEICPDVYAFIEVPGTDVAYPIAYCEDAVDPFYFTHSIDGSESEKGSIITDSMNSRDLSDPVTLIYGKSPYDGSMFGGLHKLKDASFFDSHDSVVITLPDAQLVYRIYACYTGPSDHILVSNDFNDPISFMRFFDSISEGRDLSMNIREDAKPQLGDHVIMLVTHCGDESRRLFVCAVLDEVRY